MSEIPFLLAAVGIFILSITFFLWRRFHTPSLQGAVAVNDPLALLKLLKDLQPLEPHCLWTGKLGQLWGLHLQGHQGRLPYAQEGREVWLFHCEGRDMEVDGLKKTFKLKQGDWLKLPRGIGPAGLHSDSAFVFWMCR